MNSKSKVTIILSLSILVIILFFTWYYFLNIYEVEFVNDFTSSELERNRIYKIQCIGVNAFGWRLKFRDTNFSYRIEKGRSLIKIHSSSDKNSLIFSIVEPGEIDLFIDSRYSLNPTRFRLSSKASDEE